MAARLPTVVQYRKALQSVGAKLPAECRRMLVAHAAARNLVLDAADLARHAGHKGEQFTAEMYARVGRLLANAIGRDAGLQGAAARAIGRASKDPATGHTQWRMYSALAEAVRQQRWEQSAPDVIGIPSSISRADILGALQGLEAGLRSELADSPSFVVLHGGLRYGPRAVVAAAAGRVAGRNLKPEDFSDDADAECFRILRSANFVLRAKPGIANMAVIEEAEEQAIRRRRDIDAAQMTELLRSRWGQGLFRQRVEQIESACRVTGLLDRRHLYASHIKPWQDSDDREKLDGANGLLLSPHVQHLFERGSISFSDEGGLLISKRLNPAVLSAWGLAKAARSRAFSAEQRSYLDYHRRMVLESHEGGRRASDRGDPEADRL
ncbi:MAG TPA: HNH endonuclease [Steroidobacteraceae bacterium]